MKINGFTLIELLAVIVILAIILLIAVPQVLEVIEDSRIKAYESTEKLMLKAAETYIVSEGIPSLEIGENTNVSIETLVNEGYLNNVSSDTEGFVTITKTDTEDYNFEPYLVSGSNYTTDNLTLWYPLDTDSGDISGNSHNGEDSNITYQEDGIFNVAHFNGSSYIYETDFYNPTAANSTFLGTLPSNSSNYNGNATYSFWIKLDIIDSTERCAISDSNYNEGKISFYTENIHVLWGGSNDITYNYLIETDTWYNVAITHQNVPEEDKLYLRLYLNGIKLAADAVALSTSGIYYGPDSKLVIGYQLIGSLDDLRIYKKTFSDEEVLELYNNTKYGR